MCAGAAATRDLGRRKGTVARDNNGFKWAAKYCEHTGDAVMRERDPDPKGQRREVIFFGMMLMWLAVMMLPCTRKRKQGITEAQPSSALQAIYGYRAVLRECGRWLPDMTDVIPILHGLNENYKTNWGANSLVPQHRRPFTQAMLQGIHLALFTCAVPGLSNSMSFMLVVLVCFCVSTGTRKNEFCRMTRSNFAWFKNGVELPCTAAVLSSLPPGSMLRGKSISSKCDQNNYTWGVKDQWFRLDPENPLNFAEAWRQWELRNPCPPQERTTWPAFSPNGNKDNLTSSVAAKALEKVMCHVIGATEAALRSFHAFRVTIAMALRAAKQSDGVIQCAVRWKSAASVLTYADLSPTDYARVVDLSTTTCAGGGEMPDAMPPIGPEDTVADITAAIDELQKTLKNKNKVKIEVSSPTTATPTKGQTNTIIAAKPAKVPLASKNTSATFDVVGRRVKAYLTDTWNLVGAPVHVPLNMWSEHENSNETIAGTVIAIEKQNMYLVEVDGSAYRFAAPALRLWLDPEKRLTVPVKGAPNPAKQTFPSASRR